MPQFYNSQYPPPENWPDFETLCCDLWREIWKDPNAHKNGRQGQAQHGVDIWGRPQQEDKWAAVQCKGKDLYNGDPITEDEVKAEVEKAKTFEPKLSTYIIACTCQRDENIQKLARQITSSHQEMSFFSVDVWFWEDIVESMAGYDNVIEKHYPGMSLGTKAMKATIDELLLIQKEILKKIGTNNILSQPTSEILITQVNSISDTSSALTSEHNAELDHSRDLLKQYKPKEALDYLEKTKARVWPSAASVVKFRILTNIGSAKLALDEPQEAAKLFLEALQYNPEDEKALCNAGMGCFLLNQNDKAIDYANKAIEKYPGSDNAYSLIVQAMKDKDIEDIISIIPHPFLTSSNVAYSLAFVARTKENLLEAKKWYQIALENDQDNHPDLKASLAATILETITDNPSNIIQLADSTKEEILKAIQLLSEAWNSLSEQDLQKLKVDWLINRAIAYRIVGKQDEASKDIEYACTIVSNNPRAIKQKAILAYENQEEQKAIDLLKKIKECQETPEANFFLADILRNRKQHDQAIIVLEEFLKSQPEKQLQEAAKRLLIGLYTDKKDFNKAREFAESTFNLESLQNSKMICFARISRIEGNPNEARRLLDEVAKESHLLPRELYEVADEYYDLGCYDEAAKTYKRIVKKDLDTPYTHKMVNSLYQCGERGEALEICNTLLSKYGPIKYVSEIASAIYEEIGDLPRAKAVCHEYLVSNPNDIEIQLRMAVVNYRMESWKELDAFLNSINYGNLKDLSIESRFQLAKLLGARGISDKALDIMYETRREYFNDDNAHIKYLFFFLGRQRDDDTLLDIQKVDVNVAVCIEDIFKNKFWYLIEDRIDPKKEQREINLANPLTLKVMGKSVGEEVLLSENQFSKEMGTIVELKSKYLYAFHESLELYGKTISEVDSLRSIKSGPPEKEGELPGSIKILFNQIEQDNKAISHASSLYGQGKITVGAFSQLIGKDVIKVWGGLSSDPHMGIRCCYGTGDESRYAYSILQKKPKLIIDLIAVLTLSALGIKEEISSVFGKFGVARSTIDIISNALEESKALSGRGYLNIGKEGDTLTRQVITPEMTQNNIDFLSRALDLINTACEVVPCTAALDINTNKRDILGNMLGDSFLDSVLIARQPGHLLYTDDVQLRIFAKQAFQVNGVWTQAILRLCSDNNLLEKRKYAEAVVKLTCLNYHFVSIDVDILLQAARMSGWQAKEPFRTVLQRLDGRTCDVKSALGVGVDFLYELWKESIINQSYNAFILAMLDAITYCREKNAILQDFTARVKTRFLLLPLVENEILSVTKAWRKTRNI